MRTLYPLRGRAETYVTLPMLALVLLLGSTAAETVEPGYWTGAVAKANLMLFVIVPLCAVCAAWEGARHRRGGLDQMAAARPAWQVFLVAVAPTLLMGLAGIVAALLTTTVPAALGAPGYPPFGLIGVYLLVAAAHAAVGYGLGRWLRPALALPVALGGSYIWLAYPAGLELFWLRHLSGLSFEGCCAVDQEPPVRAVLATALFALGLIVGVLLALGGTRRARISGAAGLVALIAVAVGVALPLGPASSAPRAGAVQCAGEKPVLCLWPEQEEARVKVHPALASSYSRLTEMGLVLPATLTTKEGGTGEGLYLNLPTSPEPMGAVLSMASSIVPNPFPECATEGEWPGGYNHQALTVWMALAAGVPARDLTPLVGPELVGLGEQVRQLDVAQQVAWYNANLAPMFDCTTLPRLDPEEFVQDGSQ